MVVMDVFALPVEGTETRVNAQNEAYEYMVDYIGKSKEVSQCCICVQLCVMRSRISCGGLIKHHLVFVSIKVGRLENVLGWYHSHPGYGKRRRRRRNGEGFI